MATKMLDKRDMLFPEAISADGAVASAALIALPNRLRAGTQESLALRTKIFETFQLFQRLHSCTCIELFEVV